MEVIQQAPRPVVLDWADRYEVQRGADMGVRCSKAIPMYFVT